MKILLALLIPAILAAQTVVNPPAVTLNNEAVTPVVRQTATDLATVLTALANLGLIN